VFLTPEEISDLTGRRRRDAQRTQLNAMGVEYRVRADGSIAIMRAHVERLFGAQAPAGRQPKAFTIKP
jgi:hypothetical protein